ncbi:hypothetical protein SASPL_139348 [Salvia splendens]|uniref:Cytochrome P450 n=1 Tax=Salvia splendens TaxID=180675 RepID=A0A8X8WMS2_SALSN|nr:hypothetical protein SASPL_139348 [Salvia splendens]
MLRASSAPHRLFRSLAAKHGTLTHLQLGEIHLLIVSSTEFAKQVMKTHDTVFANRPVMLAPKELTYDATGVVFSPYGDYWRHLRKICTVEVLSARRVRSFRSIRVEEVTIMCKWIASRQGSTVNLTERLYIKLNKAQLEVRKVFDKEGSCVDEDKLDELKYLKLIIKETLRLHPPTPFLFPRVNSQRCEINGYEIPAKTRVIVNAWALARDPEYWNDPEKFIPERFEEISVDFKGSNLEYIPFGAGRRMCPGMLLGETNMELPLAMLLYHFDWEIPNGMKAEELDMTEDLGFVLNRKQPLRLIPIAKRPLRARA